MATKPKTKRPSGAQRIRNRGRHPVMLAFGTIDFEIVKEAAQLRGLSLTGYCTINCQAQAYIDTGKTPAGKAIKP